MCAPAHYTVSYRINPWMNPDLPTDASLALQQWRNLRAVFVDLGFTVHEIEPIDGLPDMVYAANGGLVIDSIAYTASFFYPERQPEGPAYAAWFADHGLDVHEAQFVNEGEGDLLPVGNSILAGHGFRTSRDSHAELAEVFDREVIPLRLVMPEFYHLDTALAVLDDRPGNEHIAYFPPAFDAPSREVLRSRYPDAIEVAEADAHVFGLNAVSDGRHVVTAAAATRFQGQLREAGYEPIGVDVTELLLGGGGSKCCTLVLRERN